MASGEEYKERSRCARCLGPRSQYSKNLVCRRCQEKRPSYSRVYAALSMPRVRLLYSRPLVYMCWARGQIDDATYRGHMKEVLLEAARREGAQGGPANGFPERPAASAEFSHEECFWAECRILNSALTALSLPLSALDVDVLREALAEAVLLGLSEEARASPPAEEPLLYAGSTRLLAEAWPRPIGPGHTFLEDRFERLQAEGALEPLADLTHISMPKGVGRLALWRVRGQSECPYLRVPPRARRRERGTPGKVVEAMETRTKRAA